MLTWTIVALVVTAIGGVCLLWLTDQVMAMFDDAERATRPVQLHLEHAEPFYRIWRVQGGVRTYVGRADSLPEARALRRLAEARGEPGVLLFETAWW